MFALNATEVAVLAVWIIGVLAAISAWDILPTVRQRLAVLAVAVVVPVLGSLVAIAFAIVLRVRRRHRRTAVRA